MKFICQQSAIKELETLANNDRHSILIEGVEGCGKSYLAKMYADMIHISDFQIVSPTVAEIRSTVEESIGIENNVLFCIENLDLGVASAAYSLLKFLEEPAHNVYIVVTCRNMNRIPDTIISRSSCVSSGPPIDSDIIEYAVSQYPDVYSDVCKKTIWRCVRTFKDAETVLKMTSNQIEYYDKLKDMMSFKDTVSNIVWKLGHYEDNTETPIEIVIRYIIEQTRIPHIKKCGIDCIRDISQGRIAKHTVLTKFAFEVKYTE